MLQQGRIPQIQLLQLESRGTNLRFERRIDRLGGNFRRGGPHVAGQDAQALTQILLGGDAVLKFRKFVADDCTHGAFQLACQGLQELKMFVSRGIAG